MISKRFVYRFDNGLNNTILVDLFLENFRADKLGSITYITGPNTHRKVEDVYRKNSVKLAGRNSATVNSYDPKTKLAGPPACQIVNISHQFINSSTLFPSTHHPINPSYSSIAI